MTTEVKDQTTNEPPMNSGALTTAEQMLISAVRDNDFKGTMAALAEMHQTPAPIPSPEPLVKSEERKFPVPMKSMRRGRIESDGLAYEHEIAFYIVGEMILQGVYVPVSTDFEECGTDCLPHIVHVISQALLHGLSAYGWQHSIYGIIEAAQIGEMNGWKPRDEGDGEQDGDDE